ncbi:DNA-binding response regulator, partial [Pseudomonas sp. GW531-E2]
MPDSRQDKRIIHLVDDEEAIRRSAGFLLRTAGFEVQTYASGTAFLAAAG